MNFISLTREKLDIGAVNDLVTHESCGAVSFFVGTTRNNFDSKNVLSLEYEAYEPMALKQMEAICDEIRGRWDDIKHITICHRLGLVPVRESSVIIAVSSAHRQSSLNAVAFAIEELKRRVPIWKKELYDENESAWKENKESSKIGSKCVKRPKLDFTDCPLQEFNPVTSNLIQIAAEEHEVNRRIQCFVDKKREEIDLSNIMDFTSVPELGQHLVDNNDDDSVTCARTNSIIVKQESSNGHLRVRRVENNIGPQTSNNYLHALDKLMVNPVSSLYIKPEYSADMPTTSTRVYEKRISPIHRVPMERIGTIEKHLGISPAVATKNIYARLRLIENRILYLESISPEYKHFLSDSGSMERKRTNSCTPNTAYQVKLNTYSVNDIDSIIYQLQQSSD